MIPIKLPSFPIKISGTAEHPTVFCILRRRYVALTPEEWVRQHFVHLLIEHLHYPAALLANEVQLQIGQKQLRADTVVYDKSLRPRMIVEYKAPSVKLTAKVLEQISAYNILLQVEFLIVSNGLDIYCFRYNKTSGKYFFLPKIPLYTEILDE